MHISQLVTLLVLGVVSSAVAIPLRSPRDAQGAQGRAQTPWTLADETDDLSSSNPDGDKVNVTLYVTSRCPDARLCESVFQDVLKTKGIIDKVNLELGFIGSLNHSEPLGVTCKHGQLECLGNAHELCLHAHLPLSTFYATLACMNYQNFPGDIGKVELTRRCAETNSVDWWGSGLGKCIEGNHNGTGTEIDMAEARTRTEKGRGWKKLIAKEGHRRLLSSVNTTQEAGITTSCTIEIASSVVQGGKRVCVVDAGVWKGCDDGHAASDFVRVIEKEWEQLQPKSDR